MAKFVFVLVFTSLLLTGCSEPIPVPEDKKEYIGLWVSSDRYISIFRNGWLEYRKKLKFGFHNSVMGNFIFKGKDIDTFFKTFIVDVEPFKDNEQWKMQIDGIHYERIGSPISYGKSNNWPEGIK